MVLSEPGQEPPNRVGVEDSVEFSFKIENTGGPTPTLPPGASGTVTPRITITIDDSSAQFVGASFNSPQCPLDNGTGLYVCNDLAVGASQMVTFTWQNPIVGSHEVEFFGSWRWESPDNSSGGVSDPASLAFNFEGYDTEQYFEHYFSFEATVPPNHTLGLIGFAWDEKNEAAVFDADESLFGQLGLGKTGIALSLDTAGTIGLGIDASQTAVSLDAQLPVGITLELPENGVVAPEEQFTISTRWLTPYNGEAEKGGLWFKTRNPGSLDFDLKLFTDLKFVLNTQDCWEDKCNNGKLDFGQLLGLTPDGGLFSTTFDFFNWVVDETRTGVDRARIEDQTLDEFFDVLWDPNVPDPFFADVLGKAKGDFSGLGEIGFGTDYSKITTLEADAMRRVPNGRSIANAWQENALTLKLDLSNIISVDLGFKCACPVPLLNGTLGDFISIASAKADPSGGTQVALSALSVLSALIFGYNIVEVELQADFDIFNQVRLTPVPPQIRLMQGANALTPWFKAGDDVTLVMPSDSANIFLEVRTEPEVSSDLRVLAKDTFANYSAGEIFFGPFKAGPATDTKLRDGGETHITSSSRKKANIGALEFSAPLTFPNPLTEPRVSLSGGSGLSFGGQKGCWDPDNLPPGTPSGISFDDNDGCIISFRDLGVQGNMELASYSGTPVSITLLNSTLSGTSGDLASVIIDPNGDTSVQLKGETRRPGINQLDIFFDDAGSSGNHNRFIIDTQFGAFISNSLFRGLTSNENQSDIILRNGRLFIDNTGMVLDNITVENGEISMQDSRAELRNLQLGGSSDSALRLTRDTLITTNSNQSFNSSVLEIGNGSMLNVSGILDNQGTINLEPGGWLTVLEGDNPDFPDRLSGRPGIPSVLNVVGYNDPDAAAAALALVPAAPIDPVALFDNQIEGSRLDTGVLLLSNGVIETTEINNIGGTIILMGGEVIDTSIVMSGISTLIIGGDQVYFSNSSIDGVGRIEILPGASVNLDATVIGKQVAQLNVQGATDERNSLAIINQGELTLSNNASLLGNAGLLNESDLMLEAGRTLNVPTLFQTTGKSVIDGVLNTARPIELTGGSLQGTGQIMGDLVNRSGTVLPNGLEVIGDYTQIGGGNLLLDLATTPTPLLTVENINADGQVTVIVTQTYLDSLADGDMFEFLNFDSITGKFSFVTVLLEDGSNVTKWRPEVVYESNRALIRWVEVTLIDIGEFPVFFSGFEF
jgi:hypothetical protein